MKIAIYSRKSKFTGKGESIENQIIKCKKFIEFKFEVSADDIEIFIDEGFSGKNEDRPAYQAMINKVKDKQINNIIIYQLNRLGRNARDIHNTMELCNELGATIYSATEGFDSSTSFGRAVIGILASLAQLEREQLAERVKDNMYTLAKMGRWLGGQSPLGFNSTRETYIDENMKERSLAKLKTNKIELDIVKNIFQKYLEVKSLSQVQKWALQNNLKGKNGADLKKTTINSILQNPVYAKSSTALFKFLNKNDFETCGVPNGNGLLRYGKTEKIIAVTNHKGIIESDDWIDVQKILKENTEKAPARGRTHTALLTSVLRCTCGSSMRVCYGGINKEGVKRFYYTCSLKNDSGKARCDSKNINGSEIEKLVIEQIKGYNTDVITKELEDLLMKTNKINLKIDIDSLENEINNNKLQIDRLIKKLSLTEDDDLSKLILSKVSVLKNKNKEISSSLKQIKEKESLLAINQIELNRIIAEIEAFNSTFDYLNFEEKKAAINNIIEKIDYDNSKQSISITYKIKKN